MFLFQQNTSLEAIVQVRRILIVIVVFVVTIIIIITERFILSVVYDSVFLYMCFVVCRMPPVITRASS